MMTLEQKFIFDVQGYIVLENVLSGERMERMRKDMSDHGIVAPANDPNQSRFSDFFQWGKDWTDLIDEERVLPFLEEMLGPYFRLDHWYGMAMSADGVQGGEGLHHEANMFHHGCYYVTHREKMHNGLIVVSYALTDIEPGKGGFACIPGSHKALYPVPGHWYALDGNPMVRQVPQKAGDVLIFTESLTHGTYPWTSTKNERRSILLKYSPQYMHWGKPGAERENIPGLNERQKLILEDAYIWQREKVPLD